MNEQLTLVDLRGILREIRYRDGWCFRASELGRGFFLQVLFSVDDQELSGRKWYVSPHMARSEVVQTALMAILAAEEHEARERFRYRGQPIFRPHYDVDRLHALCAGPAPLDVRISPAERAALVEDAAG